MDLVTYFTLLWGRLVVRLVIITARCYTERCYEIACRLSICNV